MRRRPPVSLALWGLALLVGALTGCAGTPVSRRSEALDLGLPQRIAVLPFVDLAEGDGVLAAGAATVVDLNPLLTDDDLAQAHAPRVLRSKLVANLHRTELEVLSPLVVDHWLAAGEEPPLRDRAAYARRLSEVLGADLIVFGSVTHWDRHYLLLASWVTVGLRIELRDGRTGAELYAGEFQSTQSAGIHKGMIAVEPAQVLAVAMGETMHGLRNTLFASLSSEVAREAVRELLGARGSEAPHVRHLAGRWIGHELRVLALGTPGARALVKIPGRGQVPLRESAPGVYTLALEAEPESPLGTALELELVKERRRTRALATVPPR